MQNTVTLCDAGVVSLIFYQWFMLSRWLKSLHTSWRCPPVRALMDMNRKGCNLMVSPSSMAQPITGHLAPHLRVHTGHSFSPSHRPAPTSSTEADMSTGPGNALLFPSLSLRRQVLTNGKHHGILHFSQSPEHPGPSLPFSSSSIQSVRSSCHDNGKKGKKYVWEEEIQEICAHQT